MATSDAPLNVPNVTLAVARGATIPVSNADFSYFENFEGLVKNANWSQAYNASVTNNNPVIFDSGVTIVSLDDPISGMTETPPLAPTNAKISAANPSSGRTGGGVNCALKFDYFGTLLTDAYSDAFVEQRWEMNPSFLSGASGLTELWMQYDEYIPANYYHRDGNDAGPGETEGRKELAIFANEYSNTVNNIFHPTFILGAVPLTFAGDTTPSSIVTFAYTVPNSSDNTTGSYNFYGSRTGVPESDLVLIDPAIDSGHWQRRTLHIKVPTSDTLNDGVVELWVQRQAEAVTPMAVEKLGNWTGGAFYTEGENYLNKGYLLGYSNDGFTEDTTFLVDNLIIASSIDSIDQTAIN